LTLGKPAQVYLLDEPSSYLDSSQRLIVARVIKRFVMHARKTAFIIDHDLLMSTYLADRVMVFSGQPGVACSASAPQPLVTGMNAFLRNLGVTFRRDPTNHRPRINKLHSVKDREQKAAGTYFYVGDESGSSSFSSHA
jgi:ATP-binding cassette subfamily E protein 1